MKVFLDQSPLTSGHKHRGIGAYTRGLSQGLSEIGVTLTELKKDADIIHYPYFDLFAPTFPFFETKPTVATIHDVIPLEFPNHYKPGKKGTLAHIYQRLAIRRARAIITDSAYSKSQIVNRLGLAARRIHVTPLAPADSFHSKSSTDIEALKKKLSLPTHFLLYVGDINYNKNIPQLIKALKFLPEFIHLVLFGKNFVPQPIPEWQWIETQLELSQVRDRVIMLAQNLDDDELSALYSAADAYIQPSLSEGFGLPVLEAMRCRTPVISSNGGSLPEVGGEWALYTKPDAENIARAVEDLLSRSESNRQKLVRGALQWAKQFSWKRTAEATLEVYKTTLQK